jgi:hypothetical protein
VSDLPERLENHARDVEVAFASYKYSLGTQLISDAVGLLREAARALRPKGGDSHESAVLSKTGTDDGRPVTGAGPKKVVSE